MTAATWLGTVSGVLLISSAVFACVGYRRFSNNFIGKRAEAMVQNAIDRLKDEAHGPADPASFDMEWYRDESDRTVRRIYGAVGDALPDFYAYGAIILAGTGALLGLIALFVSN